VATSAHTQNYTRLTGTTDAASSVSAIALVHDLLTKTCRSGQLQLDVYLTTLCESINQTHPFDNRVILRTRIQPRETGYWISAENGTRIGQAVCELISNAARHGFPGDRAGRIEVALAAVGRHVICVITDDGVGCEATNGASATRGGLGLRIIDALVTSCGGEWRPPSDDSGTTVTINVSMDDTALRVLAAAEDQDPTCSWRPSGPDLDHAILHSV